MKKKVFIILGIAVIVLVMVALVTSYADSARVRNSVEPVHTIKIVSEDGCRITYWGLGYKVIRYWEQLALLFLKFTSFLHGM